MFNILLLVRLPWRISFEICGTSTKLERGKCPPKLWSLILLSYKPSPSEDPEALIRLATMVGRSRQTRRGKWRRDQPSGHKTIAFNVKAFRAPLRNWHRPRPLNQRTPPPANLTALSFIHPQGEACRPEEV